MPRRSVTCFFRTRTRNCRCCVSVVRFRRSPADRTPGPRASNGSPLTSRLPPLPHVPHRRCGRLGIEGAQRPTASRFQNVAARPFIPCPRFEEAPRWQGRCRQRVHCRPQLLWHYPGCRHARPRHPWCAKRHRHPSSFDPLRQGVHSEDRRARAAKPRLAGSAPGCPPRQHPFAVLRAKQGRGLPRFHVVLQLIRWW